jgi:hypothetical protein
MTVNPEWIAALTTIAVAAASAGLFIGRRVWHVIVRTSRFLDDFFGEPERNGVPARPGVMARLAEHEKLLAKLVAETQPNGGTSLRDVVARTSADVTDIKHEQARLRTEIELRGPRKDT